MAEKFNGHFMNSIETILVHNTENNLNIQSKPLQNLGNKVEQSMRYLKRIHQ